ncbi:MAG: PH domain-containing protein [Candidatus Dormibacteria bacterium]
MAPQMLAGERPITVVRQHWLVLVPTVILAVLVLSVGFTVLELLPSMAFGFHARGVWRLLELFLVLGAVGSVVATWLRWRSQTYMLTDHRIVVSQGVVARVTESISLDRVQDTRMRQGMGGRLLGCGDVEIESSGRDGTEVLNFIPHPESFHNALITAIENHRVGALGDDASGSGDAGTTGWATQGAVRGPAGRSGGATAQPPQWPQSGLRDDRYRH